MVEQELVPLRSSWSVVTPGAMCLPTSTIAWAAIREAIRNLLDGLRGIDLGSRELGRSRLADVLGRGMEAGTASWG